MIDVILVFIVQRNNSERSNEEWLQQLQLPEPKCNVAINDLRDYLVRGLSASFKNKRLGQDIIGDLAQESILRILDNLSSFRGKSRFTTWAMKIAVNLCLSELRKKQWREVSLDELRYPDVFVEAKTVTKRFENPEDRALKKQLVELVNTAVREELTQKQREAMSAIMLYGIPMSEVARKMNTTTNALYKLMHDARKKIKKSLQSKGIDANQVQELLS